ncbi:MAG: hypothetical protein NXI32_15535 [bacterium]|nr:hypothetical protein [bacterium]
MKFSLKHGLLAFTLVSVLIGVMFSRSWLLMSIVTVLVLTSILFATAIAVLAKKGSTRSFFLGFSIVSVGTLVLSAMFPASYEVVANATVVPLLLSNQQTPVPTINSGYSPSPPVPSIGPTIRTYPTYQPATTLAPVVIPSAGVPLPSIPYQFLQQARQYVTAALAFMLGMAGGVTGLLLRRTQYDREPLQVPTSEPASSEISVVIPHAAHAELSGPKGKSKIMHPRSE